LVRENGELRRLVAMGTGAREFETVKRAEALAVDLARVTRERDAAVAKFRALDGPWLDDDEMLPSEAITILRERARGGLAYDGDADACADVIERVSARANAAEARLAEIEAREHGEDSQ
jgi:hypothetical protein